MSTKIPADRLAAYHARLAERRVREAAQQRPPVVWEGLYDELYERGMAWLDGVESAPPGSPAENAVKTA